MNLELINQLYLKLKLEYKTKKEIYERIKRELSLDVKTESIKKAHERYLKKKETGQDKTGHKKKTGQDKSTKIKTEILLSEGKKTNKELATENGISERTFYRHKKQLRETLIQRSEKALKEAAEYAYPDQEEILKRIKGKKRNILIESIKVIEGKATNKDVQVAVNKALENIKIIEREIMQDIQVVGIYTQAEYEKQLIEEEMNIIKLDTEIEVSKTNIEVSKTNIEVSRDRMKNDAMRILLEQQRLLLEKQKQGLELTPEEEEEINVNIENFENLMKSSDENES
ncbi:MAG: hypothetical protein LBV03_04105 [Fusobacteriales bacterium]|jgi:hypothetical protein|nr:hypothetical protein [Fusobacteriales bacterium]